MPASSGFASVASSSELREYSLTWAAADTGRAPCPGCQGRFPLWTWVDADVVRVLTHDGDRICPGDPTFGRLTGPELVPAVEAPAVAA